MTEIDSELILGVDVDSTLIFECESTHPEAMLTDYYGMPKWVRPHHRHVRLLKSFKARNYVVLVHSANGHAWATTICKLLQLEPYVDFTMTKMKTYIDDLSSDKWMLDRIWLEEKKF